MRYYFDDIGSEFRFGKYTGLPLCYVIAEDPSYLYWCVSNIHDFALSPVALKQIRELFPLFIVTLNFSHCIRTLDEYLENYDDEYDVEKEWHYSDERPTYERYVGSYAQDEMGWSDDDIDTVLDGEPDAYWNID